MFGKYPVHPEDFLRHYDPKNIPELFKLDNVIITPHMGGSTQEMFERSASMLAESVYRFLKGDTSISIIKPGGISRMKSSQGVDSVYFMGRGLPMTSRMTFSTNSHNTCMYLSTESEDS